MREPANSSTKAKQTVKAPKRSRTGCITCKIRRVKCDETRPACTRCIATGRTCDGYPAAGVPSQHSTRRALATAVRQLQVVGPAARVLGKPLPVDDVACFDFFRLCTASMTASVFPGEKFWSLQMLQAAHAEPAVWKAAVALGAFHRRWEYSNYCLNPNVTRRPGPQRDNTDVALFTEQALKHYGVSLSLAKSISDPNMLTVLSVALGAAAHLAGRWTESQVHIRAGLRILREMGTQFHPSDLEAAAQALERLDAQAMSLSDATSPYEYTSTSLEESRRILLGNFKSPSVDQNPSALLGPMEDLGQTALATFRLMRQFFIIADAVTTGAITPPEFEQARVQMVEANAQCQRQLTWLVDMESSRHKFASERESRKTHASQTVLILSLRLYQTTMDLLLLAHGSSSGSFPLPTWATNDQDILSKLAASAMPNRDTPTPNITTRTGSKDGSDRESASPSRPRNSSSPGLSPMSTPASEYYIPPQVQPKAPVAPTSPSPTLVPSRSPSPYASAAPSPRPSPGPCPRPVQVQSPYQSRRSYNIGPATAPETLNAFVPPTFSPPPSISVQEAQRPDQSSLPKRQSSEPNLSQPHEHEASDPNNEAEEVQIPTSETKWDALHAHFKLIVHLASEIAKNTDSPLPFFMSLEPGLAMPLYFTVKRCRHPVTRRRALGLLRRLNRQEGVWNCALAARAAEEVVILEEGGLISSSREGCSGTRDDRESGRNTKGKGGGGGEGIGGGRNGTEEGNGSGNDDEMEDVERDFERLGTEEGGSGTEGHGQYEKRQGRSRSCSQNGCSSEKKDEGLLLPLDIFEKGGDGDKTCGMSSLLEECRLKALGKIRGRGRPNDSLVQRSWSATQKDARLSGEPQADGYVVMGDVPDEGGGFRGEFMDEEKDANDAPGYTMFWEDGWPNIPEDKRILVQYPIFKMEENQLELLMFVVGGMKDGEDRGKMAKRIVVDLF